MPFAHLKEIMGQDRLSLRGSNCAKDEFILAATAQNLREMVKLLTAPARRANSLRFSGDLLRRNALFFQQNWGGADLRPIWRIGCTTLDTGTLAPALGLFAMRAQLRSLR